MNYTAYIFVVLPVICGECLGFILPLKLLGHISGVAIGIFVGSLFAMLGGVMVGYLFAGYGEELAGTGFGVPLGLLIGTFLGTIGVNFITGAIGAMLAFLVNKQ